MKKLILLICTLFVFQLKAQDSTNTHYEIVSERGIDVSLYKKILDNVYLDSLRFVHERRTIEFTNSPAKVILYSGDELLLNAGKIISNLNIVDPSKARKIKFFLTVNNTIKFVEQ